MIEIFNIGKYIYSKLSQTLTCKVYPLVADNNAKFPFVVYKRRGMLGSYCKDGLYEFVVQIEVITVSDTYNEGLDISQKIIETLRPCSINDMDITDVKIIDADELFNENAYIQTVILELTVN